MIADFSIAVRRWLQQNKNNPVGPYDSCITTPKRRCSFFLSSVIFNDKIFEPVASWLSQMVLELRFIHGS